MAEATGEQQEGVELKAFGASINIKGKDVLPILRFIAMWSVAGYVVYAFHVDHKEISQTMREMTYIVSLPPDTRGNLRLDMPDSLRNKVVAPAPK